MSIRVSIDDMGLELSITVSVSGGYNPDVLNDLQARCGETYRAALIDKMAVMQGSRNQQRRERGRWVSRSASATSTAEYG